MKQSFALILTVLLLCTAITPSVLAADAPSVLPTDEMVISAEVEAETTDTVTDSGEYPEVDDSIANPSEEGIITNDDETTDTVNAETPHSHTDIENNFVPEETTLVNNLDNTAFTTEQAISPELTIMPAQITLTHFEEPDRSDAVAFPVGTTQEELSNWFADSVIGFTGYDTNGNSYNLVSNEWSLDTVNTGTVGVYYAFASPNLGTEFAVAEGVSLPMQLCAVSIQKLGEPDINCCVSARGFLRFPWVLSAAQEEQMDDFNLWLRQNSGEWTSLSSGFSFVSDSLHVSQQIFTYGNNYELKVTYPGGQTGVLSFQYDDELSIIDYSNGDRDGGDTDGGGSGSGNQPAPTPSDSNENDNQSDDDNTPTPINSSSETDGTPQDSALTPIEPQKPIEEKDYSSDKALVIPTVLKKLINFENNKNNNSDNIPQLQHTMTDKLATDTTASPVESVVTAYSNFSPSNKPDDALTEPENNEVPNLKDSTKVVSNHVSNDNNTKSETTPESQLPVTVTESYSPTQTVISGLRLRDLCNDEENVVFGSGDVTVSIPSSLLLALNLSDSDTLSVSLTQPESNQILLSVEISGKSVTELAGAVLRIRYMKKSKNTDITIHNEDGKQIIDTFYDGELLRFAVDSVGTYTIAEQLTAQESQKGAMPLLPVSGGIILATGGISFFRRRRNG